MKVVEYTVGFRAAAGNGTPMSGDVWFDDGRAYSFFARIEHDPISDTYRHMGRYLFSSHRKMPYGMERFTFTSRPREQALVAALNS